MVKIVDCPLCTGGKLKIEIANGYRIIFDGKPSRMPLKKKCKCCGREVKHIIVREEDYERTLAFVQSDK